MELNEISLTISSFAMQAMLYEVSCFPSPGLISPVSNGAHTDMNYYTFIDSISVLGKYMPLFAEEGYKDNHPEDIFRNIRKIGIAAERDMFLATNGVNTHKGMLFLMGIVCAAAGKTIYDGKGFDKVQDIIKAMTAGIVEEELSVLKDSANLSHGERLYLKYKNTGIRGEVEKGIPVVFTYSLELYKQNMDLSINDRLVHTLIGIMGICNDSTIIHRHNPKILEEVKEVARQIMQLGGIKTTCGREKINHLCEEFAVRKISPGGSADLLAVTVFLFSLEQYMNSVNQDKAKDKRRKTQYYKLGAVL